MKIEETFKKAMELEVRGGRVYKKAIKLYVQCAEEGYAPALEHIADKYFRGVGAKNFLHKKIEKLVLDGAEQGNLTCIKAIIKTSPNGSKLRESWYEIYDQKMTEKKKK